MGNEVVNVIGCYIYLVLLQSSSFIVSLIFEVCSLSKCECVLANMVIMLSPRLLCCHHCSWKHSVGFGHLMSGRKCRFPLCPCDLISVHLQYHCKVCTMEKYGQKLG